MDFSCSLLPSTLHGFSSFCCSKLLHRDFHFCCLCSVLLARVVFQPFDSFCFNSTCSLLSAVFELLSAHSRWQELSASNPAIVPTLCPVEILGQRKSSGGCPRWSRCSYHSWTWSSTSILAQCQELTRQVLQGSYVWNRLVKNSRLSDGAVFFWLLDNGLFQEMLRQVNHLVAILKLLEDPTDNLENLLDAICQRCSEEEVTRLRHLGSVKIHRPTSPDSCQVLFSDFLLLEAVEGGLGTAVQVVEEIVSTSKPLKEPILSSLASRLSRQQKKITLFDCLTVHVDNIESAEAFKTLI